METELMCYQMWRMRPWEHFPSKWKWCILFGRRRKFQVIKEKNILDSKQTICFNFAIKAATHLVIRSILSHIKCPLVDKTVEELLCLGNTEFKVATILRDHWPQCIAVIQCNDILKKRKIETLCLTTESLLLITGAEHHQCLPCMMATHFRRHVSFI